MTETVSLRRQLLLLVAALAFGAFVAIGLVSTNTDDQPTDTRPCDILSDDFAIYSKLISEHDRSWPQWEAAEAEKWAAYDAARAKDCAGF